MANTHESEAQQIKRSDKRTLTNTEKLNNSYLILLKVRKSLHSAAMLQYPNRENNS